MRLQHLFTGFVFCFWCCSLFSQQSATININTHEKSNPVSPTLHGVFFEEISHAGEGGLYAELIQNRGFEEADIPPGMTLENGFLIPPRTPHFSLPNNGISDWKMEWPLKTDFPAWSKKTYGNASLELSLSEEMSLNTATPHSLKISVTNADDNNRAEVVNEGFWAINVAQNETYNLHFYLRNASYKGNVTALLKNENEEVLASAIVPVSQANGKWKKYSASLKAHSGSERAHFALSFNAPGTLWLDVVSLFPAKTFRNRRNGLRSDLAQYIADLKPAFIRWPGGCFVEGITIQSAPDWKETIGPIEKRGGTYSPWGYWTSNGFGYHEYLQFCEDIGAAALYVFNAGVSCDFRSGTFVSLDSLRLYIQNALEAIEYAIGPITTKWGAARAKAGHPKPFPLRYVEVGNEQYGPRYAERYNLFYAAIKTKYPSIKIIASMGIGDVNDATLRDMKKVDVVDEHAYKWAGWAMRNFNHFDQYKRGDWDMYVGEYATNAGVGSGNMEAALSDAVYIMSMEKSGDLVKMSSYAPLLVNTNDVDWPVNLINFNAAKSFARISYYVIKAFNENKPDYNLPTSVHIVPLATKTPAFSGGIGLATWDTKTAYKDIEVIQNGRTVYKSDFLTKANEWALLRGTWQVQDSALAQLAEGAQQFAALKDKSFDTYTLKLKAKKLDGYNAFIISFAVKDSNSFLRAHIGSWVNKNCVFEKVSNGYDVANISASKPLPAPIESNCWYDIELRVGMDTVACYLDGKLLMTYTEPEKLFAIAGRDEKKKELVLKIVNAYGNAISTEINIDRSVAKNGIASLTTITAPELTEENSFENPKRFTPSTKKFSWSSSKGTILIKPYSVNVLRVPEAE